MDIRFGLEKCVAVFEAIVMRVRPKVPKRSRKSRWFERSKYPVFSVAGATLVRRRRFRLKSLRSVSLRVSLSAHCAEIPLPSFLHFQLPLPSTRDCPFSQSNSDMAPKKKVERPAQENISLGPQVREGRPISNAPLQIFGCSPRTLQLVLIIA